MKLTELTTLAILVLWMVCVAFLGQRFQDLARIAQEIGSNHWQDYKTNVNLDCNVFKANSNRFRGMPHGQQ